MPVEARDLFSQYKGKITETESGISIVNTNKLIDFWGKEHRVECSVEIKKRNGEYSVWFEEKTLEILGGGGLHCATMDDAIKTAKDKLMRYRFERKANEQTALF